MVRRETDPAVLNRIANDPAVRPFVDYRGDSALPMDFTILAELRPGQSRCVVLSNGDDAFAVFEAQGHDEYQGHTFFGPTCRGRRAIEAGREMLAYMFDRGAKRLWGATPLGNRAARWFNRQLGFRSIGVDDYEVEGAVELFEMRAA